MIHTAVAGVIVSSAASWGNATVTADVLVPASPKRRPRRTADRPGDTTIECNRNTTHEHSSRPRSGHADFGRGVRRDGRSVEAVPRDLPRTLGSLKASGHVHRGVKDEIR